MIDIDERSSGRGPRLSFGAVYEWSSGKPQTDVVGYWSWWAAHLWPRDGVAIIIRRAE